MAALPIWLDCWQDPKSLQLFHEGTNTGNAPICLNGPTALESQAVGAVVGVSMRTEESKVNEKPIILEGVMGPKTRPVGSGRGRERPRSGRLRAAQTYSLATAARRSLPPTVS